MLKDKIIEKYKEARRNKDNIAKDVLGIIVSNIKNKEIELKTRELEDEYVIKILEVEKKQIKDTILSLEKVDRKEDIEIENKKMEIIDSFLPEKLTKEDLINIIEEWQEENFIEDESLSRHRKEIFKYLKENYGGLYDGKQVNEILAG